MRTVGILGGMGPEATVELMRRIIRATPARSDADHVPMLVSNNPQVPSRIAALIDGTGVSPAPELMRMARCLEAAGADYLVLACNTAHHYLAEVASAVTIPVWDAIALSADFVARAVPGQRVGLLASPAVRRVGLFDTAFANVGVQLVPPLDADQATLLSVIQAIKRGDLSPGTVEAYHGVVRHFCETGVTTFLVGCSELSILDAAWDAEITMFDVMQILAAEIVVYASADVSVALWPACTKCQSGPIAATRQTDQDSDGVV